MTKKTLPSLCLRKSAPVQTNNIRTPTLVVSSMSAHLPDMFRYLDDTHIPRTTNALEGYFGRLKQRYRQHRGLARHNRDAYFRWYVQLCPR